MNPLGLQAAAKLTTQRRIRHLSDVVARNLVRTGDVFMTLHELVDGNPPSLTSGTTGPAFYMSEVLPATLNPSWAPFSAAGYADGIDLASDVLVVRVWRVRAEGDVESGSGGTAGETAAAAAAMTARLVTSHGFGGRTSSRALVEDSMVLFEWVVDFRALVFLGVELNDIASVAKNDLLFRLGGLWYGSSDAPILSGSTNHLNVDVSVVDAKLNILRVDKSKVVPSYTESSLTTTIGLLRKIKEAQDGHRQMAQELTQRMERSVHSVELLQLSSAYGERLASLRAEVKRLRDLAASEKAKNEQHKATLQKRKVERDAAQRVLVKQRADLDRIKSEIQANKEVVRQTTSLVSARRSELLQQVQSIFQIKAIKPPLFSLSDIHLPNSDYNGHDDEQIAAALGWTCQIVLVMAYYCDVPLVFTINPMGSRSTIRDDVFSGQEFPLYNKKGEQQNFQRGVFFLNKSIEQLLMARGHTFQVQQNTLPNLHYLLNQEISRQAAER